MVGIKLLRVLAASMCLGEVVLGQEYLIRFKKNDSLQKFFRSRLFDKNRVSDVLGDENIGRVFEFGNFKCLSAKNLSVDIIERLRSNPFVADIVPDLAFELYNETKMEQQGKDKKNDVEGEEPEKVAIQYGAPRHLGRLSSRNQLPFNIRNENEFKKLINYYYEDQYRGENVMAYIIDTGIFKEHPEFNGRAIVGIDTTGEGPGDMNGHGTHVAGLVGSRTFGVAKNVTLVEVKVLSGKGTGNLTTVLSGIEFAVQHCKQVSMKTGKKCVANMSLGTVRNNIINAAIQEAHNSGVVMVVAAGNSNVSACWTSPASSKSAITVGAFDDRTETIAYFSNWGACVDIFASGVKIKSLSNKKELLTKHIANTGTSMASPVVAGMVAVLLDKGVDSSNIKEKLIELSTKEIFNRITLFFKYGTPNRVAYNGIENLIDDDEEDEMDAENTEKHSTFFDRFKFDNPIYPKIKVEELAKKLRSYKSTGLIIKEKEDFLDDSWVG